LWLLLAVVMDAAHRPAMLTSRSFRLAGIAMKPMRHQSNAM